MRTLSDGFVKKIKTYILCSVIFFFFRKSYSLRENVEKFVESGRPQMTIWRMRIACWIPEVTETHTQNM